MHSRAVLLLIVVLVGGCTIAPPLPPQCTGELTPINADQGEASKEGKGETRP